jgi:DNA-binding transcriptional LysR family regulator
MQLTIKQIRYFLAAAETGQFSAAAMQVHVTQTAITSAIRELEQSLNLLLFERHHASGVSLTADGQRFLQHAMAIMATVNAAIAAPGTLPRAVTGTVHLTATSSVYGHYAIPALARFKSAYPAIDLKLQECTRPEVEDSVAEGKSDIGMIWLNSLQNIVALDALSISRSRRQLWLSSDHPLLQRRQVSLHDVAKEPYAVLDSDETKENTLRFWQALGLQPNIVYTTGSIEALRSYVAQGMAVTIISDVSYRPFSREGLRIDTRPLQEGLPPIEIGLVWRRGQEFSPAVQAFKSFMELTFNGPGMGVKVV